MHNMHVLSFSLCVCITISCIFIPDAFDTFDPNGNSTIKWDVISWTPDGYVAVVTINNFQKYRHIQPPGWSL
ncbi:hypothetical protein H5410_015216 [Solanum commersonii]|uniref:Uncharacterized protein n=1 Tax=Solanum commersonii TaxID=4109 RepID=A0A9J5ZT80_SOLCO|nr:hypothetical protein H5410_015216 [Solanum commersonii]